MAQRKQSPEMMSDLDQYDAQWQYPVIMSVVFLLLTFAVAGGYRLIVGAPIL